MSILKWWLFWISMVSIQSYAQNAQWVLYDSIIPARRYLTGCTLDKKIYLFGGQFFFDTGPYSIIYDPIEHKVDTSMEQLPVPLFGASSCVVNGKIYVIGGRIFPSPNLFLNTVYEYDPKEDHWSTKSAMPTPRMDLKTVVIDGIIFAIGGWNFNFDPYKLNTVEAYDPESDTWTPKANMLLKRYSLVAEVSGGKIYVTGDSTLVERYDPELDQWEVIGQMPHIAGFGSGEIDGDVYVFGGSIGASNQALDTSPTWKYNPNIGIWEDAKADFPVYVDRFAFITLEDCFFIIGGMNSGTIPVNTVYKWCPTMSSDRNSIGDVNVISGYQNFPNPFDTYTVLSYELIHPSFVSIVINDINGKELDLLFQGIQSEGPHHLTWLTSGLPNGVYFFRLRTETSVTTLKCILLRQ